MSVALQFKLTQSGQAAVWNARNTGISLNLTHIQFGSGNRAPSGTETALLNPQQAVPIAAGFSVSPTQIRMSAIFSGNQNYVIREVGVWAGDPAANGSKLVGYWSQAAGDLAMKSPGVDFIFSHDMTLDAAVPAGGLTILADNAQSAMLAMIAAHEAKADPHPQYATVDEVDQVVTPRFAAHRADPDPHSQYARTDFSNVRDGTIAPGKLTRGAPTWSAGGHLLVDGRVSIAGGRVLGASFLAQVSGRLELYRLATLPASTLGTFDQVRISGVYGGWTSSEKSEVEIVASNRGGLGARFLRGRARYGDVGVRIYAESNGTATIYLAMTGFAAAMIDVECFGARLYVDTPVVDAPTGALVWDSSTHAPLSYFDNAGKLVLPAGIVGAGAVGEVVFFARPSAPDGYLKANGAGISRTAYSALFAAIGTTFGAGDGTTTFNVPDLRGEFIRAFDEGRGADTGRAFGSWQPDLFRSHTHSTVQMIYNDAIDGVDSVTRWSYEHHNEARETGVTGGIETRPRNVALLACIKY